MHSLDSSKGSAWAALFCPAIMSAVVSGFACAAQASDLGRVNIGAAVPAFVAKGADGRQHRLKDFAGKLVVLEWTSPVCPFTAVKYTSGSIQDLQRYAAAHDVIWLSIDTAAPDRAGYLTAAAARERIVNTQATITAFLFDPDGRIGRRYGSKTTPSFFVVDRDGKLAYQGAMDDQVFADQTAARQYLKSALDDLFAGRPVRQPETLPQGCAVEY